ncbi:MAG: IclR family transcriptional regulator [Armatimonadota bacterium]|nr:IclR family transcriptional regulator [Armatimonadota bacterium]
MAFAKDNRHIKSLVKGLRILRAVGGYPAPVSISVLSRHLLIPKGTLFPFLQTMAAEGMLLVHEGGRYTLGPRVLELASMFHAQVRLRDIARPQLEWLARTCGEVAHLCVLSDGEMVYLDRVETRKVVQVGSRVGGRCPIHCTGVGKAFLAFLSESQVRRLLTRYGLRRYTPTTITSVERLLRELRQIRQRGYSIDRSEHDPEVRCVGAPIFNHEGQVIASISAAGPAYRMTAARVRYVSRMVARASREISCALGYRVDGPSRSVAMGAVHG